MGAYKANIKGGGERQFSLVPQSALFFCSTPLLLYLISISAFSKSSSTSYFPKGACSFLDPPKWVPINWNINASKYILHTHIEFRNVEKSLYGYNKIRIV